MSDLDKQLIEASKKGDLDKVKHLVKNGADIHTQDDYVLIWSAIYGHLDVVKYLVENGANIHTQDDYALRWSAGYGYLDVVKYLVENGADQKVLFKIWDKQQIVKVFREINDCNYNRQHTDELCSELF